MEEAVSTSILVRLCLIQRQNPVFLSNPSSWFSIPGESFSLRVRETSASRHTVHTWSLFPAYLRRCARIIQQLINPPMLPKVPGQEERKQDFPCCHPLDLLLRYICHYLSLHHCFPISHQCAFLVCFDTCSCCEQKDQDLSLGHYQETRPFWWFKLFYTHRRAFDFLISTAERFWMHANKRCILYVVLNSQSPTSLLDNDCYSIGVISNLWSAKTSLSRIITVNLWCLREVCTLQDFSFIQRTKENKKAP